MGFSEFHKQKAFGAITESCLCQLCNVFFIIPSPLNMPLFVYSWIVMFSVQRNLFDFQPFVR